MADAPDILSPVIPARPDAQTARALIARLVRGGVVSPDLLALLEGPLAQAVATAAEYAAKAIAPGTVATYKGD